jgi:hypothetical protein
MNKRHVYKLFRKKDGGTVLKRVPVKMPGLLGTAAQRARKETEERILLRAKELANRSAMP